MTVPLDADAAWKLLLAARRTVEPPPALAEARDGDAAILRDLYLDFALAGPHRPMAVGHLGQSLDGRIATLGGDSHYVNGPEDIDHLHRMRALADAVIVGAETVRQDDARLTTRRVEGPHPARVVIDSRCSLNRASRVFADDGVRVIVVCAEGVGDAASGRVEHLAVPVDFGALSPRAIARALHGIGLHALFVEGGGATVSRFLADGALDRLQVAIAPIVLGSGRHGIDLPPIDSLTQAMRPRIRHFPMGNDVLFDCDLSG